MVKNFLIAVLVVAVLASGAGAQSAPVNANTLDGIAPGYAVSAIGGLKIDVASGKIFCSGTWVTWLESTLLVTNSTTNYVYLNTSSSCVPAVKTTPFTVADVPLAVVVAAGGQVTSVAERRGVIALPPSATGNLPSGSSYKVLGTPVNGSSGNAALIALTADFLPSLAESKITGLTDDLGGKQAALGFTAENVANKSTDGTLGDDSDTKYPSQKAAKTYVDGKFTGGSSGKTICWKTAATLGYCSTVVAEDGTCTCN